MDDGTGLHIYWLHSDHSNLNIIGTFALGPYRHSICTLGRIQCQYVSEKYNSIIKCTSNTCTEQLVVFIQSYKIIKL